MLNSLYRSTILLMLAVIGSITQLASAQEVVLAPSSSTKATREAITTADFGVVRDHAEKLIAKHGSKQTLLVLDIDNTLLAMNQSFGSDQWFDWQSELLKKEPCSELLVAKDFDGLLQVQGLIFEISHMHPPQPDIPAIVSSLQEKDVAVIVLTSRGPNLRHVAERELKRNGYGFQDSAPAITECSQVFLPFNPTQLGSHGINTATLKTLIERLAPVSYANGIFMTAGQHKGYMLKQLLGRMSTPGEQAIPYGGYRAVLFVDDHAKHTSAMAEAFEGEQIDLTTVRYSREDGNVKNFKDSDKRESVSSWNRLREAIDEVTVK